MIKCVIIDDGPLAINVLEAYISKMPNLLLIGSSTSPLSGIQLVQTHNADLVFLDIQMDEMTGLDVTKILGANVKVIFCTAYSEFAASSYELQAVDYLLKPIGFSRFVQAVQRASNALLHQASMIPDAIPDDYIFVKSDHKRKMIKIDLADIVYIQGMGNYVAFHIGTEKILAYLTMKDLEERLPLTQFIRVHKSYIVAFKHISTIENDDLIVKGSKEPIPLGSSYRQAFMDKMKNRLLNK